MLGAAFALLSAVAFSCNAVLVRRGVVSVSPSQATFITVVVGVPLFLVAAVVSGQVFRVDELAGSGYAYLAAGGVINFVIGRHLNYLSIEALGAARAAPFQSLTLPYSAVIALLFLGEEVSLAMAAGVTLVMVGPLIMVERRIRQPALAVTPGGDATTTGEAPFVPRQAEGYLTATLAAVAYGTSPILFRAALEDASGFSMLGGLVSYVAATVVMLALLLLPGRRDQLKALQPATMRLFFGASFSVFVAQMLRFLALSLAPVAVVLSLERMNSVFTLVLSYRLNRALELITLRVVIGILTSLAGALVLVATL